MSEIKLGQKVKDKITDFEGVAIAKCEYLHGTPMYQIAFITEAKDINQLWIDAARLETVDEQSS
ncbi:MAG: hypothetical protein LBV72_10205 [Tannerella sp.]|jgi:hypothetical protein|nr:hypothetical protein [Tannerella sp.]